MVTNISGMQNITKVYEVFTYANTLVPSQLFGLIFIISFWITLLVLLIHKMNDFIKASLVSSFVTFVFSLGLVGFGFLSPYFVFLSITAMILSAIPMFIDWVT